MSSKKFLIIAALVLVFVLVAVNWTQVKAAIPKITGALPGGTDVSGAGGSTTTGTKPATTTGKATQVGSDYNKALSKGVEGREVLELQQLLNRVNAVRKHFVYNLVEDGKFGPLTETMLKYYNGNRGSITLNEAYARLQQFAAASF